MKIVFKRKIPKGDHEFWFDGLDGSAPVGKDLDVNLCIDNDSDYELELIIKRGKKLKEDMT